jgi:hypothetical protein
MQDSPFFSVIVPVYNRERHLKKALDSLLSQTFQNFETIIVDDASTDSSLSIANNHPLYNKQIIANEKNSERCVSRNKGIKASRGKYICFLDSDDYHLPEHLELLHSFILEKGEPEAFFFTNAWDATEEGIFSERECPTIEGKNMYTYFLKYTVNPQRWAVHRNLLLENQFDPEVTICEDMDVSLRILSSGAPVFQLNKRTTAYVAASDSFTHGATDKWERELLNLEKIFARPILKDKLSGMAKNRLRSMCRFHLATKAFTSGNKYGVWSNGIKSFFLFPCSYNRKTNKPLFTMLIYSTPLLGCLVKYCINKLKK